MRRRTSWSQAGRRSAYDMSRLRRVAQGSGGRVHEVVDLVNRFAMMRQMMLRIGQSSGLFG